MDICKYLYPRHLMTVYVRNASEGRSQKHIVVVHDANDHATSPHRAY